MVVKIKNLLTDKHVVNKPFNEKCEDNRRDLFLNVPPGFLDSYRTNRVVLLNSIDCTVDYMFSPIW